MTWTLKVEPGFLQTPLTRTTVPVLLGAGALTFVFSWLNGLNFKPVESMGPEYKSKENIIARTETPPVFINPIYNGIPGNVLGPEDLERRG